MANTNQTKQRNTVRPKGNGGAASSRSGERSSGSSVGTSLKKNYVEPLQERAADVKDGLAEAAESVKTELREDWDQAKSKALAATAGARERAREAADRVSEAADRSQVAVRRIGNTVARTVKDNPLPFALAGAGLAWLAINLITAGNETTAEGDEEAPESGPRRALEPLKQAADTAVTQVKGKVQKLTGEAGELASRAQSTLGQVTHDATESARRLATQAAVRGKQLEQSLETTLRENPLAAGAAALALGAAIGTLLPRTRLENEWLGEKRDAVIEKGQELAHTAVSTAEAAVRKVANVARAATEES